MGGSVEWVWPWGVVQYLSVKDKRNVPPVEPVGPGHNLVKNGGGETFYILKEASPLVWDVSRNSF